MTTTSTLDRYIKDLRKVSDVSNLISRVCELQKRPALETLLLNKWAKIVLDSQEYGEDAFIMARSRFINFLQSGKYVDENSPLVLFLIDTLCVIY